MPGVRLDQLGEPLPSRKAGKFPLLFVHAHSVQNIQDGEFRMVQLRQRACKPRKLLTARMKASVITLKPAIRYQFKTGQRAWPETRLFYLAAVSVCKAWFEPSKVGPIFKASGCVVRW
jgi:hypothetical protein